MRATDFNVYRGNSGRVTRMPSPEPEARRAEAGIQRISPPVTAKKPPRAPELISGGIGGLLEKLNPASLETEDMLLLLILYLLYRETGDPEMLIIMGAMYLL